jgi:hypothetical protein
MESSLGLSSGMPRLMSFSATGKAARPAGLAAAQATPKWLRESEPLIGRLIQHGFFEARVLQPLLDRTGSACCLDGRDSREKGREEA